MYQVDASGTGDVICFAVAVVGDSSRKLQNSNAVPRNFQRWPGGIIPYEIAGSLTSLTDTISRGMKEIEKHSCIRFVPREEEHGHYIRIFKGDGCYSYLGFSGREKQDVSLGPGCGSLGIVLHELMHAIGFKHEHNRSDRDNYLTINWDNIPQQWHDQFIKLSPKENKPLSAFDFDSIMLYGNYAFSKQPSKLKSIEAKDGRFMPEVYNKKGLSQSDIYRLKILYECNASDMDGGNAYDMAGDNAHVMDRGNDDATDGCGCQ